MRRSASATVLAIAVLLDLAPRVSASIVEVTDVYIAMNQTVYSHKYVENIMTGYYAWTAVHQALNIRRGYVPTPTKWAGFRLV